MPGKTLLWDQTLFRRGELFEFDHIPEHFAHRDSQFRSLIFGVRPALRGMRPLNMLCVGPPGTGKTTAARKAFEELGEHAPGVIAVHVNCQASQTRYTIFSQIFLGLIGHAPPTSGVSFKKILDEIANYLIRNEKILIVVLDDINYLFHEKEADNVLYSLLRAHETHPGTKIGIIAILSDDSLSYVFDPKVGSIFLPEEILFPRYSWDELKSILSDRAKLGFYPGVLSEDVLEVIVDYTSEAGDLRVGIDLLKRSALNSEERASMSISEDDVRLAYRKSRTLHLSRMIASLGSGEQAILTILARGAGAKEQAGAKGEGGKTEQTAGDLYAAFHESTGLGYTRFHAMLHKLATLRLIDAEIANEGVHGRSRRIALKYDSEDVLGAMQQRSL
ncbi:MAG: ORC1-type DNA replication protein 2 [Candidatus Methanogaster sp.]|nr:MAG: ORC1-type DNA replication protein 2 [ANME-2 cluster archaeon]